MLTGYPEDWTKEDVMMIGIMYDRNKVNTTKLLLLYNLTTEDYDSVRSKLNIKSDFCILFRNLSGGIRDISNITLIGDEDVNINGSDISFPENNNLIKNTRLIMAREEPIKMEVYTWI